MNFLEIFNKILPALLITLILGMLGFWANVNKDIAVIKDDLKWSKDTYKRDRMGDKEILVKIEDDIKQKLSNVLKKEDKIQVILLEIVSRLKVIEYKLQINNKKEFFKEKF